jgi:glutathione S-transferase
MHLSATLDLVHNARVLTWADDLEFQKLLSQRHDLKIASRKEKTAIPKMVLPTGFLGKHPALRCQSNGTLLGKEAAQEGLVVAGGSSGIMHMLADLYPDMCHLYPIGKAEQAVIQTEHYFDTVLGSAVTSFSFANTLLTGQAFDSSTTDPRANAGMVDDFLHSCVQHDVPLIEKVILKAVGKSFLVPRMCQANNVNSSVVPSALSSIHAVFQAADQLLTANNLSGSAAHSFLLGTERISAADITFASLAAPLLMPPQTASIFTSLPKLQALAEQPHCEGARVSLKLAQELRARYKSAQYVLDLYAQQRFLVNPPELSVKGCVGDVGSETSGALQSRVVMLQTR